MTFIHFVQKWNAPLFLEFMKFLDYLDSQFFYFIFFPLVWMAFGTYHGRRIYFVFLLSNIFNHSLKQIFAFVRPFEIDPSVGIIKIASYGFPSGAAQSAILLCALLIYYWKSAWAWPIGIAYGLLLSFSRVYLGVHFPLDIFAGWLVGGIIFIVYLYLFPWIEKLFEKNTPLKTLIISLIIFGTTLTFPSKLIFYYSSITIGIFIGVFLTKQLKIQFPSTSIFMRILIQTPTCILGIFFLYYLREVVSIPVIHNLVFPILLGFWIAHLAYYSSFIPYLWKKSERKP